MLTVIIAPFLPIETQWTFAIVTGGNNLSGFLEKLGVFVSWVYNSGFIGDSCGAIGCCCLVFGRCFWVLLVEGCRWVVRKTYTVKKGGDEESQDLQGEEMWVIPRLIVEQYPRSPPMIMSPEEAPGGHSHQA